MLNLFNNVEGVEVFMSGKKDGNMKLFSSDFIFNRKKYFQKNNLDYSKLVAAKLEHDKKVVIVENNKEKFIDYADGLLTNNNKIILGITSADCLPIFLFDPIRKVVGILHCGWKSVAMGLVENSLKKIKKNFDSQFENILVGVGPGIQECHFEIKDDTMNYFNDYKKFVINKNNKKYLDLKKVVVDKFTSEGIDLKNIEIDSRCSYCDNNFWSYRRDGVGSEGIRVAIAGIKLIL